MILAGGDGMRLRSLTLLEQTWRRTGQVVRPERTLLVFTRRHERFYQPLISELKARHVVAQPENRGTAAGILYPLLRLAALAPLPEASVAVFPSDHHCSDEARLVAHVDTAFASVEMHPERVLLLGIVPDTHEAEYGWIERGERLPEPGWSPPYTVARFWEKPDPALADVLRDRGCYWNSFIMVARVSALLALIRSAVPDFSAAFSAIVPALGTASEPDEVGRLYQRLSSSDFFREVLSMRASQLVVLPVHGLAWSDLGNPERVRRTERRLEQRLALTER
jgi:mannose-1-phosphate guanylyltransferase